MLQADDVRYLASTWLVPLIPGVAHAVSSISVGFPFDTVKTRMQVGMHETTWKCFVSTVRSEGPTALYRGALMPLTSLVVKRPFEFAAFEWCSKRFGERSKGPFLGGSVAGILSSIMGCPFSVVKIQMQSTRKDLYKSALSVITDVWRSRGPLGFYRGFSASLIMNVPSCTMFMGSYGTLREHLPNYLPHVGSKWIPALAGMLASVSMWSCLLPLDNVRTVMQAKSFKTDEPVLQWRSHFMEVIQSRGIRGLYAGLPAVLIRAPIVSACSMVAYEQSRAFVGALQK